MEIRIQAMKFDASERLQAYIEKKVTKLEKVFDSILTADIYLKVVKPEQKITKKLKSKLKPLAQNSLQLKWPTPLNKLLMSALMLSTNNSKNKKTNAKSGSWH